MLLARVSGPERALEGQELGAHHVHVARQRVLQRLVPASIGGLVSRGRVGKREGAQARARGSLEPNGPRVSQSAESRVFMSGHSFSVQVDSVVSGDSAFACPAVCAEAAVLARGRASNLVTNCKQFYSFSSSVSFITPSALPARGRASVSSRAELR